MAYNVNFSYLFTVFKRSHSTLKQNLAINKLKAQILSFKDKNNPLFA